MNRFQYITTICCLTVTMFISRIEAQLVLPEPVIAHHFDSDCYIRWEPNSILEWKTSFKSGVNVELLDNSGSVIWRQNVLPLGPSDYNVALRQSSPALTGYFDACMGLLYPASTGTGQEILSLMHKIENATEETLDSFKLSMLSFYSSYNMQLAKANGLGTIVTNAPSEATQCRLSVQGFESTTTQIKSRALESVPTLIPTWGDRIVKLDWNISGNYSQYIGYQLERSVDGIKFFSVYELPVLDPGVGIDGNKSATIIGVEDSLAMNYKDYYYRLRSVDYFGRVSSASAVIKGYGFEGISGMPQITYADQEKDNKAQLKWNLDNTEINKIKSIAILHSDQMDANYQVLDSLGPNTREAIVTMTYDVNYYRIELIPFDGEPVSSFPVFVMGVDTIAPVTPIVIGATIDTIGRIVLQWKSNTEPDLWGYRIFRANFGTDEYALQNATPTKDSFFIDSVSLRLGTKNVYYVLQAVDKRNNRSAFTEPIVLAKPDIIPPACPIIEKVEQAGDSILIHWVSSASDDVIKYELFRRRLDSEEKWRFLMKLDTLRDSIIIDTTIEFGQRYVYSMRAVDDVGLQSDMCPIKTIAAIKPKILFKPSILTNLQFNPDSSSVDLNWTSSDAERISSVMVYRGWSSDMLGKYKYCPKEETTFTDPVTGPAEVYYKLKITYQDEPTPYYSETVHLSVPKSSR